MNIFLLMYTLFIMSSIYCQGVTASIAMPIFNLYQMLLFFCCWILWTNNNAFSSYCWFLCGSNKASIVRSCVVTIGIFLFVGSCVEVKMSYVATIVSFESFSKVVEDDAME